MEIVADFLSTPNANLGRPVVDKTGLTGAYTMQLEFQFRPRFPTGAEAPVDDFSASLFTALREQWGLKRQSAKGNVDVIVVDQASASNVDFKNADKEAYIRILRDLSATDLTILNYETLKGWFPHTHDVQHPPEVMGSLFRLQGMGLVLEELKAKEVSGASRFGGHADAQRALSDAITQPPKRAFYLSKFGQGFLDLISAGQHPANP